MAGKGLFNKLIDTFNTVADDARRQLAPKDTATSAPGDQTMQAGDQTMQASDQTMQRAPTDSERAVSAMDTARQVSPMDSARQVASDSGRQVASGSAQQLASDNKVCRHCSTPVQAGMYCTGCGAPTA